MPNLHRLALLVATLKPLLHRFQVPIWSIAIAVSRPAKQGHCKCMTVKRIVRCFANSLNLVSNLIEFGQQIQWIYSAVSMIFPYCHDDIRALKNCCMSQTKVALLSKTNCFAEQIDLSYIPEWTCRLKRQGYCLYKQLKEASVFPLCVYRSALSFIVVQQVFCHENCVLPSELFRFKKLQLLKLKSLSHFYPATPMRLRIPVVVCWHD